MEGWKPGMHAPARVHAVQYHYQRREREKNSQKAKNPSREVSVYSPCARARTLCAHVWSLCRYNNKRTIPETRAARRRLHGTRSRSPRAPRPPTRRRPTVLSLPAALKLYREMLHITLLAGLHSQDQTSTGPAWCTTIDQLPSSWRAKMLTQAILAFPGSIFSRHAQNANLPATEH